MNTFKEARKNNIPASFSRAQPDKLFIKGKLWPVGKPLVIPEKVRLLFFITSTTVLHFMSRDRFFFFATR